MLKPKDTDFSVFDEIPPALLGIQPDIRVAIILCPSFTMLPVAAFMDSLRHAADEADFSRQIYCTWKIVGDNVGRPVIASCGAQLATDETADSLGDINYLVVAGGQLPHSLSLSEKCRDFIVKAYNAGVSIVGLCTGSFVLAELGLLDGRRCAVHPEHIGSFQKLFPDIPASSTDIFIVDREVLTCPGGTSALDLAFHIIDTHCGKARAVKGLNSLLVENHRSARKYQYRPFAHLAACGNSKVEAAIQLMERHIVTPYPISKLASMVSCSERELCRLFRTHGNTTPSEVWRNIRLAHGHWLILNSGRTITQISYECGFADAAHFARWFKEVYKEPPYSYRRRRKGRAA